MGDCMSRLRGSKGGEGMGPDPLLDNLINNKPPMIEVEQFDQQMANRRQVKYWGRRLNRICDSTSNEVTQQHIFSFFNYSDLSKETVRKLYLIFKDSKPFLTKEAFIDWLQKIVSISDAELSVFIYNLYFLKADSVQSALDDFEAEFKQFLAGNKQSSYNLNGEKTTSFTSKMKQLSGILEKRKSSTDSQQTIKWLLKNIKFANFKSELLQGGIRADEIVAYKQFWHDYSSNSSKIRGVSQINKKDSVVKFINWRWCEKLLKYLDEKYVVEGAPKLRRRQTTDLESPAFLSVRYKSSMELKQGMFSQDKKQILNQINSHRSSIRTPKAEEMLSQQHSVNNGNNEKIGIKVIDKHVGSGLKFRNHPGEIDNHPLLGNFQWELKRNIRKQVDYLTITQQTYDKLVMAFGGGPNLERRIIQGYIQLRPYFICSYLFTADLNTNKGLLSQEQLIKVSSSQLLPSINLQKFKNYVCYHRNVGEEWEKFQINYSNQNSRFIDVFTETSFLIYMAPASEQVFKRIYKSIYKTPKIGDKYCSKTYKIIEQVGEKTLSTDIINVCVVNDQERGFLEFVVLNWTHHIRRKIPLVDFQCYFTVNQSNILNETLHKQTRAGISNLGNTCYINAIIQSLFSTFKDDQLSALKGELGIELKQIQKTIVDKKKNVFPVEFKTVFDKYYAYFQGQDQHDAHEFCLSLFDQLEKDKNQELKNIFESKHLLKTKCLKCLQSRNFTQQELILTLPIRDFAKKQVKIDHMTENRLIRTVTFTINENSTVQQWKQSFEKASGASQYFLCEVENSLITRTFNKKDNIESEAYQDLNIENHFLITAYESKPFKSNSKLESIYTFRTYKNLKTGELSIARIEPEPAQQDIKSFTQLPESTEKKLKVKIPSGNLFEEKIALESQLLNFPEDYPVTEMYVKVINYDAMYNQITGRPFVFKIPSTYPICTVREALENCIGTKGYTLRISPLGEYAKCQICKRYNQLSSSCFMQKEKSAPICWIDGILEFVVVWQDAKEYRKLIERQEYSPSNVQSPSKIQKWDKFQTSLASLLQSQKISNVTCDFCKTKNIEYERQVEVKKWPEALIIHLIRFKSNGTQIVKIHTKWKLEQTLYIENSKYVLKAVLCHIGMSADFGHYVAVSEGTRYDDELVTEMKYDEIDPEQIYMLFYRKVE